MADIPAVLVELAAEVDDALDRAYADILPRLRAIHPSLTPVTEELARFSSSGKRIRPVLLLLGFRAAGGRRHEAVLGPALALELVHTFALIHDDVIDAAPTRRGRPSVHRAFAQRHHDEGWHGDAGHYGEAVAILAGDVAFVHADELFLQADVPDRVLLDAFGRFNLLREEVMAGQYLDLQAATDGQADRAHALTVATLKSGRYSVSRPLELGAALAGGPAELIAGLRAFGDPLGRAFQVRDDLLGVFGASEATGKSVASDLAEGKRTLLVAEAFDRLDADGRAELERDLGRADLGPADADRIRTLLEACGARAATEAYVEAAIDEARRALAALEVAPSAAGDLDALAGYLGRRDT